MTVLYEFLTKYNFFTVSKTALWVWVLMLAVAVLVIVGSLVYWAILERAAYKFYAGKSPEDELVQKFDAIVCLHEGMCRIVILSCLAFIILTVITFLVANKAFVMGIIIQSVGTLILLCLCALRLIGEYQFCTGKY